MLRLVPELGPIPLRAVDGFPHIRSSADSSSSHLDWCSASCHWSTRPAPLRSRCPPPIQQQLVTYPIPATPPPQRYLLYLLLTISSRYRALVSSMYYPLVLDGRWRYVEENTGQS